MNWVDAMNLLHDLGGRLMNEMRDPFTMCDAINVEPTVSRTCVLTRALVLGDTMPAGPYRAAQYRTHLKFVYNPCVYMHRLNVELQSSLLTTIFH